MIQTKPTQCMLTATVALRSVLISQTHSIFINVQCVQNIASDEHARSSRMVLDDERKNRAKRDIQKV